jgi:ribonuclease P protein component
MIATKHRFHGYRGLRAVYRFGLNSRGPLFAVKSLKNDKRGGYRLAVVVSRKVHKSAVARNRIRRRLYEVVRQMEDQIDGPHDIVLTVFSASVLEEPTASLSRQVKKQFKEVGALSKPQS